MNRIKIIGRWLINNSKWIVPIAIKAYEIISKRIRKNNKSKPVASDKLSGKEQKQDQD